MHGLRASFKKLQGAIADHEALTGKSRCFGKQNPLSIADQIINDVMAAQQRPPHAKTFL